MVTSKCWDVGVGCHAVLVSLSSWLHHRWTDLFMHLQNAENTSGFERTGNCFVFFGCPFRAQQRALGCCFRPGGISPVASKSFQALSGIIALEGGVRPVWEQRGGEHSQTAFLGPLESAGTTHTAQLTSCGPGIEGTSQEGPERKLGRKTSLVSGILLAISHHLAGSVTVPLEQLPETPGACPPVSPWPSVVVRG